jgi:hypothetical protein
VHHLSSRLHQFWGKLGNPSPTCFHQFWGKVLINITLKTKLIERGIPELGPIVTANGLQAVGMLIVEPQSQALKVLKHFILTF